MQLTSRTNPALLLLAWITGCNVLAPLDEVRDTREPAGCTGAACVDAATGAPTKAPELDADGGKPAPPRVAAMRASTPTAQCVPARGVTCNPVARCGCASGLDCELNDWQDDGGMPEIACVAPKSGMGALNEPCRDTSECAAGLSCGTSGLCTRYCAADRDCGEPAECLSLRSQQGGAVPGTGACLWLCDPTQFDSCGPNTECRPASDASVWRHAICSGQRHSPTQPQGAPCTRSGDCEHNLDCADFGPRVCTQFCRTAADCPTARPLCHMTDLRIAAGQPVGHCVEQCGDASLPAAEAWSEGAVWSKEEFDTCSAQCSGIPSCMEAFCTDGARYQRCMQASRMVLASQPGSVCRRDYVSFICSATGERSMFERMLQNCIDGQPRFTTDALPSCVAGL